MINLDTENIFNKYRLIYEQVGDASISQVYAVNCAILDRNVFAGSVLGSRNYVPEISMEEIFEAHIRKFTNSSFKTGRYNREDFLIRALNNKTYLVHLDDFNYLFVSQDFNDIIKSIMENLFGGDYSDIIDVEDSARLGQLDVDFDSLEMNRNFIRGSQDILMDALTMVSDKHKDIDTIFRDANSAIIRPPANACEFAFFYQDGSGRFKTNTKRSLTERKAIYWPVLNLMKVVDSLGLVDEEDVSDLLTRAGYLPED
jgi:hypothetical protein